MKVEISRAVVLTAKSLRLQHVENLATRPVTSHLHLSRSFTIHFKRHSLDVADCENEKASFCRYQYNQGCLAPLSPVNGPSIQGLDHPPGVAESK